MQSITRRTLLRASGAAALSSLAVPTTAPSQDADASSYQTRYPDIPRVESHAHIGSRPEMIQRYHQLRALVRERHGADLAIWINLGNRGDVIDDLARIEREGQGRVLSCISDYKPHDGLDIAPAALQGYLDKGFVGYKIWAGPPARRLKEGEQGYPYIDHPAHIPTFKKMEEIGMVAASIHIADPNGPFHHRTQWLPDPVDFWTQMMAFRNVVARYPNLVFVAAHAMWSICQDAQIDYLRYMLTTHTNLYIDLAATFQYFHLVRRDNLRDFMIDYSDRILFGTDISRWGEGDTSSYIPRYLNCFRILETDAIVAKGFFGGSPFQGLHLPRVALENIYYKNATRVYPRVQEQLTSLGYKV